jgi:hypothetical protein
MDQYISKGSAYIFPQKREWGGQSFFCFVFVKIALKTFFK